MSNKRTIRVSIAVDIKTSAEKDKIKSAIKRGIYWGLDSEPSYIAPPKDVLIYVTEIKEIWQ